MIPTRTWRLAKENILTSNVREQIRAEQDHPVDGPAPPILSVAS